MTKEAFRYAQRHVAIPAGRTLRIYGEGPGEVYSPFAGTVAGLRGRGAMVFADVAHIGEGYDAVLVQCPKQQEETEGLLALAFARSKGFVMAVAPNDAGGNRLLGVFEACGVEAQSLSKDRCKIVYTTRSMQADREQIERNLALLTPHALAMEGRDWWTLPGLFGWNKVDAGSKLLVEHLPRDLAGKAADFGCGFGYLSAALLAHAPGVITVDAYDADARAVAVTRSNTGENVAAYWQDMRSFEAKPVYDVVVMNPPFHTGKEEDIGLGELFIRKGWESLRTGGRLFMVANRNLPYEQIVPQLKTLHAGQGYKVMAGRKL